MFYTLTFNPALDYILNLNDYHDGMVNRSINETILPGGKGINVSLVLSSFGIENIALGFKAGFTGEELERLLKERNIKTDLISLEKGNTRINVKLKTNKETEINAIGPVITSEDIKILFNKLDLLKENDYLILSGSVPKSLPTNIYCDIAEYISDKKINLIVDAEKDLLLNVLKFSPFLIKPNQHELEDMVGNRLNTKTEIAQAAVKLQKTGARNVFVSMAECGGIFAGESGEVFFSSAPTGVLVNSTGAGDSALAGFLAQYESEKDYKKAFLMGLAAGSASAFSMHLATHEDAFELYSRLSVNNIQQLEI